MPSSGGAHELTRVLHAVESGEQEAAEKLLPMVYDELRRVAQNQLAKAGPGQTLQATALVHEAWLHVVGAEDPGWNSRAHFFGAAAQAMRQILVNQAKHRAVRKRDVADRMAEAAENLRIEPPVEHVLAVDEALERLEERDPDMARIVTLRFFAGISMKEIAAVVEQPLRTVERLWSQASAWLLREVEGARG